MPLATAPASISRVTMVVDALPDRSGDLPALRARTLMALIALFAVIWGIKLVLITWDNTVGEFPFLSVGITYMPIPIGGFITLLFIIEQVWIGPPR